MSGQHDVIVIGAGANGLAVAGLLAKAGRRVVVLERRGHVGGMAAGEEFHPGFRGPGPLHDTCRLSPSIVSALDLESHGLKRGRFRPGLLALDGGGGLLLDGDPARAVTEIAKHSAKDAAAWPAWQDFLGRIRGVLAHFLEGPPVNIVDPESMGGVDLIRKALKIRGLGRRDMMELLRLPPMSVADWLGEWFEGEALKVLLAWPAVAGNWMGPRSPGSNANLLVHEALAGGPVEGGAPALVAALERAARARGVEIRTGAAVTGILTVGSRVEGVVLEGGGELRAGTIAASCDPRRTILELLPPGAGGGRLARRMESFRMRGTTGQVLLALDRPPRFPGIPEGGVEIARLAGGLDDMERAFDPVKYRRVPDRPILELYLPPEGDGGRAPQGKAVASILVHSLPTEPEGGWTDGMRSRLGDRVLEILEARVPGLGSLVLARKVLAPPDIEREYGVTGGHLHHGEHALDQLLVRPVPECQGYATPVAGLYLCGMGSHPGGGLTCLPARNAAAAILSGRVADR